MNALNILEQLKTEHLIFKELFNAAQSCQISERGKVVQQIKKELIPHARGEEKTIYSLLRCLLGNDDNPNKDLDLINEAYEEHRLIDNLITDLEDTNINDERWIAVLKVLQENIEHHIEEEESELFKLINRHFSDKRLKELKSVYLSVKITYAESLPIQAQIEERRANPSVTQI